MKRQQRRDKSQTAYVWHTRIVSRKQLEKLFPCPRRSTMSDRQLAAFAYLKAGIPISDFPAHYAVDSHKSSLRDTARRAYEQIWASHEAAL